MSKQYPTKQYLSEVHCNREFAESVPTEIVIVMARQLLAGLAQEPVACVDRANLDYLESGAGADVWPASEADSDDVLLYTAPQLLQPAVVADIDARMKAAGMLSAVDIIAGQPIDAFVRHSGVVDMGSLLGWAEMRRTEFLRMQARYELGDKEKDDLYEWVVSHVAAFGELHVNIRAAILQGKAEPVQSWIPCSDRMPDPKSELRVCVYTPSEHEDMRYRFVPASLFKVVCAEATHWRYMGPPEAPQQEVKP